ncbi:MAG: proton-conducting transporter membrane subunit [Nitrospirota bacterium]
MSHYYPLLIPLAPLVAALLTALPGGLITERSYRIGAVAHLVAFVMAVLLLYQVAAPEQAAIRLSLWASPWSGVPSFELAIDRLAAVMMVLISGIGSVLYYYSIRYMQQERGRARYQTLLALAIATLLFMVSSANLMMLFLFWQLLSWLLSLLAHNYAHPPTVQGAFRTFIMLRAGDVAFLAGIVLAYHLYGTVEFSQLFARAADDHTTLSLWWPGSGLEISGATAVTLLIFIGAMSKSAQFPLHMWLPDSLYAPTPIHALLHAGIINAGGFLLNRLAPLYGLSPLTLHVVFAVGLLTALLGAAMMLTQNDIKKTLGYSTIGQMGYMIMECGLGAFALAVFHLIAHGLFKATIFLNCGNVIHVARQEPRVPHRIDAGAPTDFSGVTWATGFLTSLLLPLVILLAAHGALQIPLWDSQGVVIFLFFSWVTSSQAILTLYRLRAIGSWKVAGIMLLTLVLVMSTYLFAAERFTHFLYPAPGEVSAYFHAAALPVWLFDGMIAATALFVTMGWIVIYAKSHGRSIHLPEWISAIQIRSYLVFMNRLYLDGLALRLRQGFGRAISRLDRSRGFLLVSAVIALALAAARMGTSSTIEHVAFLCLFAFMLPLFPVHGFYVAALTRLPGYASILLAIVLPVAGLGGVAGLLSELPAELLNGVSVLAVFGTVYGSIKALAQQRVARLVAYGGLSFYSMLWWHLAVAQIATPQAIVYATSVALVTGGLLVAWRAVHTRYGDLALGRLGGLARPMPRFAVLLALLVMAAVGLPPFGMFSGYVAMLLHPSMALSLGISVGLTIILVAWFTASWYLFALMQRVLFGPHRSDLPFDDLGPAELAPLVLVLVLLLVLGIAPHQLVDFFGANTLTAWNAR